MNNGHEGKWAVIKGERLLSTFDDAISAYEAGADEFGVDEPFLVRQIRAVPETPTLTNLDLLGSLSPA